MGPYELQLDRPDEKKRSWYAYFRVDTFPILMEKRRVEIVRTAWEHTDPYYWTMINSVGTWPGTESDEWIEYIPPDGLVEGDDGNLWYRKYVPDGDYFLFTQMTKGSACDSSSTQTASR